MKRSLIKSSKLLLTFVVILYSAYFIKTILGINISDRYSANGIFKKPLSPVWSHKTELCKEFQTLCKIRSTIKNTVQRQLDQVKRDV